MRRGPCPGVFRAMLSVDPSVPQKTRVQVAWRPGLAAGSERGPAGLTERPPLTRRTTR